MAETLDRRLLLSAVTATTNGNSEIDLSITPDATATTMEIDRSTDGVNYTAIYSGVVVNNYPDTGLSPDTTCYYNVTNADSNGSYASTPRATTGPNSPTIAANGSGPGEIDLSINADSTATAMQILRNGAQIYSGGVEGTFADTGLSADSAYSYTVNTSNSNGSASAWTTGATGPSAPSVAAAANGSGEIDLSIAADSTASWMQINRNGTQVYSGGVTGTFADAGLSPDSSYAYMVTTGNTNGSSSGTATAVTGLSNPAVSAAGNGNSEIDLTIAADPAATSMQISSGALTLYSGAPIAAFDSTGLMPNALYSYNVATSNGLGSTSASVSATTGPSNPAIVATANSNGTEIDLALTADSSAGAMLITARRHADLLRRNYSDFSDTGLPPDSSYSYTVTTSNDNGFSTASTSSGTPPTAPNVYAVGNGPSEIDLDIAADSNATSMQILRDGTAVYSGVIIPYFSDTGLSADTSHDYTVTTSNANGSSSESVVAGTGMANPIVTATSNGAGEIDLGITVDSLADGMSISRNGTEIFLGAVSGAYADTGLTPDSSYTYSVTTYTAHGIGQLVHGISHGFDRPCRSRRGRRRQWRKRN